MEEEKFVFKVSKSLTEKKPESDSSTVNKSSTGSNLLFDDDLPRPTATSAKNKTGASKQVFSKSIDKTAFVTYSCYKNVLNFPFRIYR